MRERCPHRSPGLWDLQTITLGGDPGGARAGHYPSGRGDAFPGGRQGGGSEFCSLSQPAGSLACHSSPPLVLSGPPCWLGEVPGGPLRARGLRARSRGLRLRVPLLWTSSLLPPLASLSGERCVLTEQDLPVPYATGSPGTGRPVSSSVEKTFQRVILFAMFNSLVQGFYVFEGNCPSVASVASFAPACPTPSAQGPRHREAPPPPSCASSPRGGPRLAALAALKLPA